MPTSLAAQLAQAVSLNAPLLSEAGRKKHRATSYLFTTTSAQTEDIESIHALALNGLAQLRLVYPAVRELDTPSSETYHLLFSSRAKETDRTLLAREEAKALDDAIKLCLRILGPCLLDAASGKIIEWLVRRFRINEFNVTDTLALFMPYHESPHFGKMVSILDLDKSTTFAFLKPFKQAAKPIPRNALVDAMRKNVELTRFIVNLLPDGYDKDSKFKTVPTVHRTLLAFNLATLLEFITRADETSLDAGVMSLMLPAVLTPFKATHNDEGPVSGPLRKDGILGSFVLLSALSQKITFTSQALSEVLASMISATSYSANFTDCSQLITATVSVLGPQTTAVKLPKHICERLIGLPGFGKAFQNALNWTGSSKLVSLILPYLMEKFESNENAVSVAKIITSSDSASQEVLYALVDTLLSKVLETGVEGGKKFELLSDLRQRHPTTLQLCIDAVGEQDKEKKQSIESVLLKISMSGGSGDALLATADAEPSVRCAAVRSITKRIQTDQMTEVELNSLRESLRSRLLDTHTSVLDAIYEEESIAVSLFTQSADLLHSIATYLTSQQSSRALLRTHLQFFSNALFRAEPTMGINIILSLVLPLALLSKPRHKTAASVWEVVCNSPLSEHELLTGLKNSVKPLLAEGDEKVSVDAEQMAEINAAIIRDLADNFKASNNIDFLVDWLSESVSLSSKAATNDAHLRLLALLVGGALVRNLKDDHQVRTARKLLDAIMREAVSFEGDFVKEDSDELEFDEDLFKTMIVKPNSRMTLQKAQIRLLILLSGVRNSAIDDKSMMWFCNGETSNCPTDIYVVLLRDIYVAINAVPSNTIVSCANNKIFEHLGPKTLLFLAGLWTSTVNATGKYVALKHASAFLQAQQASESHVDFQVIIPSLVCALQEPDKRVRVAAMECLSILASSSGGTKTSDVYAYDAVYGSSSDALRYIELSDSIRYIQMLVEHRDHLTNDSEYISYVHNEGLSSSKKDSKKDAKYKQRIMCFLLSHVVGLPSMNPKAKLLRSLKEARNSVKLQMLAPLIGECLKLGADILEADCCCLVLLSLTAFDATCVKDLAVDQSVSWSLLLDCIKSFHLLGKSTPLWTRLLAQMGSLYNLLPSSHQHDLCMALVTAGAASDDSVWEMKPFLRRCLLNQATSITVLLKTLRPSTTEARLRESKRSKLDSSLQPASQQSLDLSRLTFFAEVLASQKLPGSLEVLLELLEILGQVVNGSTPSLSDNGYTEQLLMSAIDSAASGIKEMPNISPNTIQLDVLVKLMRTENPQTFNQALLLMASLARLSSESVLQNVLPIFTFMGSNIFHRDDSYSFKVIQKTTEGIVPVVLASLRERFTNRHDLHIGARDLLKTFTDAATHIPRHRRTNFFIHLIEVMNPAEFLAPICMLLVDKVGTKIIRQNASDAASSLSLPLSVFETHTLANKLSAFRVILAEVRRLIEGTRGVDSPDVPFLEETADEPASTILTRNRQCRSLIIFIGHALKTLPATKHEGHEYDELNKILAALVELSSTQVDHLDSIGNELAETSRWSLLNALSTIRVDEFASAILSMVTSTDKRLQEGSLSLLAERLPDVSSSARERIQDTVSAILIGINQLLEPKNEFSLIKAALKSVRAIAATARTKEEAPLAAVVQNVIQLVLQRPGDITAISVLPVLITKLGPRMIPHLHSIVNACISVANSATSLEIIAEDFSVLSALVTSIPTFWSTSDVKAVCELYISDKVGNPQFWSQAEKLVKAFSKHISGKLLLSSLLELWPSAEIVASPGGEQRTGRFFDLAKRCIHHSTGSQIQESLRNLFSRFLQALDFRATVPLTEPLVEDKVIGAYMELVVKLNETTFQPLFRRSCDWAFASESSVARKIAFFRSFTSLLELFKDLMTPYMSFVIEPLSDLLGSYGAGGVVDQSLWSSCLENLSKSLAVDDGAFWNDDKVRAIYVPLVQQIPVCISFKSEKGKALLTDCLLSAVSCAEGDPLLKLINLAIIRHSKAEEARVRLFALACCVAIWEKHGAKLSAFGIQTATFVMECSEDDNDDVVRECRRLRDAIEAQVGKIEGL